MPHFPSASYGPRAAALPLAACLLLAGLASPAAAEFSRDTRTAVSVPATPQPGLSYRDVQAFSDGGSGTIVVWVENWHASPSTSTLYAQRLDSEGRAVWGEGGLPLGEVRVGMIPRLLAASDENHGVLLAFERSNPASLEPSDVLLQRVTVNGELPWGVNGVKIDTNPNGEEADGVLLKALVADGKGGALLYLYDFSPHDRNELRRYGSDGSLLWTNGSILDGLPTHSGPSEAVLASDWQGGGILAWTRRGGSGETAGNFGVLNDIYAQRYGADGNPMWAAPGVPVCEAPSNQSGLMISSGGPTCPLLAIGWTDYRDHASSDVRGYVQILSLDGSRHTFENGVAVTGIAGQTTLEALSFVPCGAVYAAWSHTRAGDRVLHVQRIESGVRAWGREGRIAATIPGTSRRTAFLKLATDPAGGAVLGWSREYGSQSVGSGISYPWYKVFAQHLDADGRILWGSQGKAVHTGEGSFRLTSIVPSPDSASATFAMEGSVTNAHVLIYRHLALVERAPLGGSYPNEVQPVRITGGTWWQALVYRYGLNEVVEVTQAQAESGQVPVQVLHGLPGGLFLYDYAAGAYTEAEYLLRDPLQ